jgi:hypothetical protein
MSDPISSACFSPSLACAADPLPGSESEAALSSLPSPAAANTCLLAAAPAEPEPASLPAASALAQKFLRNDPASVVAGSNTPSPCLSTPPAALPSGAALPARPWDQINRQIGLGHFEAHANLRALHLTASADVLSANAHLGSQNADGSQGENVGASATLYGAEINAEYRGWSLTLGVAHSVGGSISSGEGRDIDGDGVPERCFALSLGPFTLGECDEL